MQGKGRNIYHLSKNYSCLYYRLCNAECCKALPLFDFIAISLKQLMEILVEMHCFNVRDTVEVDTFTQPKRRFTQGRPSFTAS